MFIKLIYIDDLKISKTDIVYLNKAVGLTK